ncbi:unnamed protein product [Owenia fusiformis]|uniref:Uncharacterized protein n=1 Tax=Owenia fusiformis TaxID=6347 RepID=A0A8J1XW69_OWEFU|nr:unnamed protein product [Owenia fusiformis]
MEPGSDQMFSPHENLIKSLENILLNDEFNVLGKEYVLYCMQKEISFDKNGNESPESEKEDVNFSKFKNRQKSRSKLKTCIHYTSYGAFVAIISLICIVSMYGVEWMRNDMFDVSYFIQRYSRTTLLPLQGLLQEFYDTDCLIHNPYYSNYDDSFECDICTNLTRVEDYTGFINSSNFEEEMEENGQIFILKEQFPFRVEFEDLKKTFTDNQKMLTLDPHQFITNRKIKGLEHLFEECSSDSLENTHKDLNVAWITRKVKSAQIIRRIFTRPDFVPKHSEVGLQKNIFIDGPESGGYPLPVGDFACNWYVQAHGSRVLVFEPSRECMGSCVQMSVTVNERDIVYWMDSVYDARSEATSDSSSYSISFTSSFI